MINLEHEIHAAKMAGGIRVIHATNAISLVAIKPWPMFKRLLSQRTHAVKFGGKVWLIYFH